MQKEKNSSLRFIPFLMFENIVEDKVHSLVLLPVKIRCNRSGINQAYVLLLNLLFPFDRNLDHL